MAEVNIETVVAMAAALGLDIPEPYRAGVAENLRRLVEVAALVTAGEADSFDPVEDFAP